MKRAVRKDSASGVTTDDPTDKQSEDTSSFFQPTRHDFVPLFLAILSIAIGLTAALLSFFLLQNGEVATAQSALRTKMVGVRSAVVNAETAVQDIILRTAAFYQVSYTEINQQQLVSYIYSRYVTLQTF
jgi:hypothetical protein